MEHNHNHQTVKGNENKTLVIIILTVVTMIVEIAYGYITNSMALLADGFHMGTHALALGLTYAAYLLMRKLNNSNLFPNGTNKISILAAYTSALFLGITGFWIIIEAIQRFINPLKIGFSEAIIVAIVGLIVNGVSIFIMEFQHTDKHDYNFLAAYYHILADALTSVFAIGALLIGKYFNIVYLDSIAGILGGVLIIKWAFNLIKHTVKILIDMKEKAN